MRKTKSWPWRLAHLRAGSPSSLKKLQRLFKRAPELFTGVRGVDYRPNLSAKYRNARASQL